MSEMAENKATVLIVEDNTDVLYLNSRAIKRLGYRVLTAQTLEETQKCLAEESPDLIILDVLLPDGNGLDFCRELRETCATPILFLDRTGRKARYFRRAAARWGRLYPQAVRYERFDRPRPVAAQKVSMRKKDIHDTYSCGPIAIHLLSGRAFLAGEDMQLTHKETALLLLFAQNQGQVISTERLYRTVWQQPTLDDYQAVKKMVSRLRTKLEGSGFTIVSHRGRGYCFERE